MKKNKRWGCGCLVFVVIVFAIVGSSFKGGAKKTYSDKGVSRNSVYSSTNDNSKEKSQTEMMKETIKPAEGKTPTVIKDYSGKEYIINSSIKGEYGKKLTFSSGTENEYSFFGFFLPPGDYTARNSGEGAVQLSFCTEETIIDEDTGIEYPGEGEQRPVVIFNNSEKDIVLGVGEYIKLTDNSGDILISEKKAKPIVDKVDDSKKAKPIEEKVDDSKKDILLSYSSMWGMSEDDVIGSIITGYEQCIIGEYNAIWVPNNTMFSYNMDTYYVFGENSSQYGLSKITIILNDNDSSTDYELDQCMQRLEKELRMIEGEPERVKKNDIVWKNETRAIELAKGKLKKYTGSDKVTVVIVIKQIDNSQSKANKSSTKNIIHDQEKKKETYDELSMGSRGEEVTKLQNRLNQLGYNVGMVDGDYGNKTKEAVEAFQSVNRLKITGSADQETQMLLFSKKAKKPTPTPKATPTIKATKTPKPQKTEKDVTVYINSYCGDYNQVGNEWYMQYSINGKRVDSGSTINVRVGDKITCKAVITEDDSYPDVGSGTHTYTVTEKGIKNGFHVYLNIYIRENRGRYSGNSCKWEVEFDFY